MGGFSSISARFQSSFFSLQLSACVNLCRENGPLARALTLIGIWVLQFSRILRRPRKTFLEGQKTGHSVTLQRSSSRMQWSTVTCKGLQRSISRMQRSPRVLGHMQESGKVWGRMQVSTRIRESTQGSTGVREWHARICERLQGSSDRSQVTWGQTW